MKTPQFITIKNTTDAEKSFSHSAINIINVALFQPGKLINLFLSIHQTPAEFESHISSLIN